MRATQKELALVFDGFAEGRQPGFGDITRLGLADPVVHGVDLGPHLDADQVAQRPGVVAGQRQRIDDGIRTGLVERVVLDDITPFDFLEALTVGVHIAKQLEHAEPIGTTFPATTEGLGNRQNARQGFDALDIARHPVGVFRES